MRYFLLAALSLVFFAPMSSAQERGNAEPRLSPNATVGQTIGISMIEVGYSRPSVKGRALFGDGGLVPYGEVWRTGANEAATFKASADLLINGERLPAGTYSMLTIPSESDWVIVFNKVAEQWGSFNYDEAEDALRVTVPSVEAPMQEQFQIRFDGVSDTSGTMILHWGTVGVPVSIATAM